MLVTRAALRLKLEVGRTERLSPVLLLFLFLIGEFFVFILQAIGGFELQGILTNDFEIRAAFIAAQRVPFVDIFLFHVD
jgi:hypothetical protein